MTDLNQNFTSIINQIMAGLKDFQRATVSHIDRLYRSGQQRILVSDEVGLGKTLVARGVVAKLAKLRLEEGDNLFKVVYICSNAAIAGQNIRKLQITPKARIENTTGSRLSMQHLNIFRQEHDPELLSNYIQLIPLTPETSFRMSSGAGIVQERALMFSILRRLPVLQSDLESLEVLMTSNAPVAWQNWAKDKYEEEVVNCNQLTSGKYLNHMISKVTDYLTSDNCELLNALIDHLDEIKANNFQRKPDSSILGQLRVMFAKISIDLLEPDFVIMDEFQRFKYLLDSDRDTETGMLAHRFFSGDDVRMLLLSATPYKMYSTLEEIDELTIDEHYSEFFRVINFLNPHHIKQQEFAEVWHNYSVQLREFTQGDMTIIEAKEAAESALFEIISRTERVSAFEIADIIDDSEVKTHLMPKDSDIKSYLNMHQLLKQTGLQMSLPVEYIKSSPYIMSFMRDYQLKKRLDDFFKRNPHKLKLAKKPHLWIKRGDIEAFRRINPDNARLRYLEKMAFEQNAEKLLWVPPSKPYYELSGPFKKSDNFSKTLVFSAWEMVPRMIATMISYESERKNADVLAKRDSNSSHQVRYFSSASSGKRYPASRLNFSFSLGDPRGMPLFCLMYPAKSLADCFNPIEALNRKLSLSEIEAEIKAKITQLLDQLLDTTVSEGREDERWYYLAPLLLDEPDYVSAWLDQGDKLAEIPDDNTVTKSVSEKQSGFLSHLNILAESVNNPVLKLGKPPSDLLNVLTNIAIASPAVCSLRTYNNLGGDDYRIEMPSQIAKIFINRMNTPESTAVIEVVYGDSSDEAHWKNLLQYCKEGNLQAVLDEYAHILVESNGLASVKDKIEPLHQLITSSLNVHTASYNVDTFSGLSGRAKNYRARPLNIRSHFAVAFTKSDSSSKQTSDRRETVRNSFNSPFRPFILATTSIGQEGLDFHYYCRKIVHWNLPSNPIDIEQREGRINRYKCLAIRQGVAERYGDTTFKQNIWYELFEEAYRNEKQAGGSDLVPYWGLTPRPNMVQIERIVPMYAFSQEIAKYERLINILSLYRLTLGQPRQEELLESLYSEYSKEELRKLFLNLSPFYKIDSKNTEVST